ncbi:MAG: ATP-binding cassette domain-containing protein [Pseudomonadota bacterium]
MGIFLCADAGRRRVMSRLAEKLDGDLVERVAVRGFRDPSKSAADTLQVTGKLNQLQQLLNQGMPGALLDLPFTPFFMLLLVFVHPAIGAVGFVGAIGLIGLAVFNERLSKAPLQHATSTEQQSQHTLSQLMRQRSAVIGMGMIDGSIARWLGIRRRMTDAQLEAGLPSTIVGATSRSLRLSLQLLVLGVGAYLAIGGHVSAGAIIAGSILMGRALAPIDQIVNGWRSLVLGQRAIKDLDQWVAPYDGELTEDITALPRPEPQLTLDQLVVGAPGSEKPLLSPTDQKFQRGRIIVLLGSSGAGKTTLLQTLAGAWPPHDGSVQLGSRDLHLWPSEDRGRYVGYLPQQVQLLPGTVKDNITRFQPCEPDELFETTKALGCHELILSLHDGYDTKIGEAGALLSAGQAQAIGLARAFFRQPSLLLLDEPTAHLDPALAGALMQQFAQSARQNPEERSFTAIIATHDMRLINAADDVMVIRDRKILTRPRETYMQQISQLRDRRAELAQANQQKTEPSNA